MELTYYLYDPKTFVFTKVVEAKTQPKNSSKWPPPECPEGQAAYFNGHGWVRSWSPEEMTAERIRGFQVSEARQLMRRKLIELNAGLSKEEVQTFDQQYAEARQFLDAAVRPVFLSALAQARGDDLNALCRKIVEKAEAYQAQKARILGQYQVALKSIETEEPVLTQQLLQQSAVLLK